MLVNRQNITITMVSLSCLGIYYSVYAKYQFVASCHARLDQAQLNETRYATLEAQLDASEAALDAAEAQLDSAKR